MTLSEINRVITLAARPVGFPSETDFKLIEEPKPVPGDGQFLIRTRFVSVDPFIRRRGTDERTARLCRSLRDWQGDNHVLPT